MFKGGLHFILLPHMAITGLHTGGVKVEAYKSNYYVLLLEIKYSVYTLHDAKAIRVRPCSHMLIVEGKVAWLPCRAHNFINDHIMLVFHN